MKQRKKKDKKEKKDVIGFDLSMMRPFMEGLLKNMEGGIFAIDLNKNIIFFKFFQILLSYSVVQVRLVDEVGFLYTFTCYSQYFCCDF